MSGRVLVTGSSGFVGLHLCTHLESRGYEVFGCDQAGAEGQTRRRVCDITDTESVEDCVQWAAPVDFVVHLAAIAFVPEAARNPTQVADVNMLGTIRLIDALRSHAPKARLVFVGSSEVYGPQQETPVSEEHDLRPENPYAISKAAADHYCRFRSQNEGLETVRATYRAGRRSLWRATEVS